MIINQKSVLLFLMLLLIAISITGVSAATEQVTNHTITNTNTLNNPNQTTVEPSIDNQHSNTNLFKSDTYNDNKLNTVNNKNNIKKDTITNQISDNNITKVKSTTKTIKTADKSILNENSSKTNSNYNVKTLKQATETSVSNYDELYNTIETIKSSNEPNYIINLNDGDYKADKIIVWGKTTGSLRNITINGNNQIIYGTGNNVFMNVNKEYILNINDVTVRNFNITFEEYKESQYGGAINSYGTLNINNSTFVNNTGYYGAVIYSSGELNVNNSSFVNNTGYYGGAVYQTFNMSNITNTLFESNRAYQAKADQGDSESNTAKGGAIYTDSSIFNIENCTFINNTSTGPSGTIDASYVQNYDKATMRIINSTFKNSASNGWNGANYLAYGKYIIINSTFENNFGPAHGGAIGFLESDVQIDNCSFNNNTVNSTLQARGGGALFFDNCNVTINNTNITNCSAMYGGGINSHYSRIIIENSSFINNSAPEDDTSIYAGGGAIVCYYSSDCKIFNTTFINNTARYWGGAIFQFMGNNLTVSNSSFHTNKAFVGAAIATYQFNPPVSYNNVTIHDNYFDNENAYYETLYLPKLSTSLIENNTFLNCSILFRWFVISSDNTLVNFGDLALVDIIEELKNPSYYDADIFNKTNYTVFVNGNVYDHTDNGVKNYTILVNTVNDFNTQIIPSIASNTISNILEFTLNKLNTIITSNSVSTNAYDPVEIKSVITDPLGNPINEGTVDFYDENNNLLGSTTVSNGIASITLDYTKGGIYPVTIYYKGTDKYNANNTVIDVTVYDFVITPSANNENTIVYHNLTTTATIRNTNGELINNGIAYYYDSNNVLLGSSVVENGNIKITLNYTESGIYPITIKYKDSSVVFNVIVEKRNTKIALPDYKSLVTDTVELTANITDNEGNRIINEGIVYFYLNNTLIAQANVINGKAISNVIMNQTGIYDIEAIYTGTNVYNSVSIRKEIEIGKLNTTITVAPIKGKYAEKITLNATILDQKGNNVTGGIVVFKINGQVINDTNGKPIYVNVINGKAIQTITAPITWLNDNEKITAVYSGDTNYNYSRSAASSVNISKRNLNITLVTSPTSKADKTVLFIAIIHDENGTIIDGGKVIFKFQDNTIKDINGNPEYIDLIKGLAKIYYKIPDGTTAHNYTITTKYTKKGYYNGIATGIQEVTKIETKININNAVQKESNLILNATIKDINGHQVIGTNKISVKINGKTLRNSTKGTVFYISNGQINLNLSTLYNEKTTIKNISIVTGERWGYYSSRTNSLMPV